eukprot:366244-Chlamydomonas_euryale.AAC.4
MVVQPSPQSQCLCVRAAEVWAQGVLKLTADHPDVGPLGGCNVWVMGVQVWGATQDWYDLRRSLPDSRSDM